MQSVNALNKAQVNECVSLAARALLQRKRLGKVQKPQKEKHADKERQPHPNKNPADKQDTHSSTLLPGK